LQCLISRTNAKSDDVSKDGSFDPRGAKLSGLHPVRLTPT